MTKTIEVKIINAFVDAGQGGNPAGVVLNADRFSLQEKQQIARGVGLSETAFVSSSKSADFKLEFFTPTRQIAHCGHATIATFSYLAQAGIVNKATTSKETIDGTRVVVISGDIAFMEQKAPRYSPLSDTQAGVGIALESLGITNTDLLASHKPMIVSTGNNFILFPIRDEQTLLELKPDFDAIEKISERLDLIGYYAFCRQTRVSGRDAGARMFAPRYGINEESATGMAAGPLACYLHDVLNVEKQTLLIEQGHLMMPPSPSILTVNLNLKDGQIQSLIVGGEAVVARTVMVNTQEAG